MAVRAIVMAAGKGTRMRSSLPKLLHPACGRPLLHFPVRAALDAGADEVVIVVNPTTHEPVQEALARHTGLDRVRFAVQEVPRGTGDAVRVGIEAISGSSPEGDTDGGSSDEDAVLILSGDTPLLTENDLAPVLASAEHSLLSFVTFELEDPTGYGRVLRDEAGNVREIREHRDLKTEDEYAVREVNAGLYAARVGALKKALSMLRPENDQGEYYLTDIVPAIARRGSVKTVAALPEALLGVNDRAQLASVEKILFARIRTRHAQSGISIVGEPLIDDTVELAQDVRIEQGARLRGCTTVGRGTFIDVGSVLDDAIVGEDAKIKPHCVVCQSKVGNRVQLGPFAHLRPESTIEDEAHLGNFVETKKTLVRRGAKANHLAYLGDADVGERSNLGAGTIICNYDGFKKRRTVIGKEVFVGSDSQLVAPVEIGDGAYVATATTVTRDVPGDALAIGRVKQENKQGYASKLRARLRAAAEADEKSNG